MSGSEAICVCGHWSYRHEECPDSPCPFGDRWHVRCSKCDCHEFQTDYEMMRALKEEAEEGENIRSGRTVTELEKRIVRAETLGQEWAKADAAFYQLDETRKSVLADLMKDLDDGDTSEAKLERLARSSKVWKDHVANLAVTKGQMLRAKVKYEAAVAWYEAARTAESTNRVKMQVLRDTV